MRNRLWATLAAGVLATTTSVVSAHAGAGKAPGLFAPDQSPTARTATIGYGRSFDWHRQVPPAPRAEPGAARKTPKAVIVGKAGWICSFAGAGSV